MAKSKKATKKKKKKTSARSKKSPQKTKKTAIASMPSSSPAAVLLEDGTYFCGEAFGAKATRTGEFVFHTSPTGYQEVLTDPSYHRQVMTFAHPQIGNQGIHPDDFESEKVWVSGCVVRDYSEAPFHWRKRSSLSDTLREFQVPAISGVDTRRLILHLREKGNLWGVISTETTDRKELERSLSERLSMEGLALAYETSTKTSYTWQTGSVPLLSSTVEKKTGGLKRCVVMDFGVKRQILRYLIDSGFEEVVVVPAKTKAFEIRALAPDALFLSNGPGDPAALTDVVDEIKSLLGELPILGICLGHQLLSLALGLETFKLKFGHHAANHPVRNEESEHVEITSQNHGFAVAATKSPQKIEFTHWHLNDQTVSGFRHQDWPIVGVQFHPEASPGPKDSTKIFEAFQGGFR